MRGGETVGHLDTQIEHFADGQRRARQEVAHRRPFDEFRDDEGRSIVRADVVDRDDVGMIQRARGLRLVEEALLARRIGAGARQDLDGDRAVQTGIARAIHFAHPAGTQQGDDFIRPEAAR